MKQLHMLFCIFSCSFLFCTNAVASNTKDVTSSNNVIRKQKMINPLLKENKLPSFSKIEAKHFEPAIDFAIKNCNESLKMVLNSKAEASWENSIAPLEDAFESLDKIWNIISHLNHVNKTKEIRKAYEIVLPKIVNFSSMVNQNVDLYNKYIKVKNSKQFDKLSQAQQTVIDHQIRQFKLRGIHLPQEKKDELKKILERLSQLSNQFSKNVLDATNSWIYHVEKDKAVKLEGLPSRTKDLAKEKALELKKTGWVLTLDYPCFDAVMKYAKDSELRETFYKAYYTRASKQVDVVFPNIKPYLKNDLLKEITTNEQSSGNKNLSKNSTIKTIKNLGAKYDNSPVIEEIISLREKMAKLLEYNNYAEYSLVPKMASNTKEVMDFLYEIFNKVQPIAKTELTKLEEFAHKKDKINELQLWDIAYYSEMQQKKLYNISSEELRGYFPLDNVMSGLFKLVNNLYDITVEEEKSFESWDHLVRLFNIKDKNGEVLAQLYMDLFPRTTKGSGAWCGTCRDRIRYASGKLQKPIAFIGANFAPASKNKPALLSHNEIITLFHEFGHALQHLLTKIDYYSVSGCNGVEWDAIELPSQFMENWCWDYDILSNMSMHYKTGEKLPKETFLQLLKTKNYHIGMRIIRQLEFAISDFRLHLKLKKDADKNPQDIFESVAKEVGIMLKPDYCRNKNCFSHIFSGAYAAGYYSYMWAEVLSSDVFYKFIKDKNFKKTGYKFLSAILEKGGSLPAMDLFVDFMGRRPKIDAFLQSHGIN